MKQYLLVELKESEEYDLDTQLDCISDTLSEMGSRISEKHDPVEDHHLTVISRPYFTHGSPDDSLEGLGKQN